MSLLSNMRGPRLKTPLLLLLLLLLSSLTEKAFSQDERDEDNMESTQEPQKTEAPVTEQQVNDTMETHPTSAFSRLNLALMEEGTADSGSGSSAGVDVDSVNSTDPTEEEKELDLLTILIPAILAVVLIAAIICGTLIIKHKCHKKSTKQEQNKEDPYLDGPSTEKVPMPMFEEDIPSVLELEMDELDKWMQKDI